MSDNKWSVWDITIMKRCFSLAMLGGAKVKNNPLVGCVITCNDRIIGEGYHQYIGGPHAEINALNSVKNIDRHLISQGHLYVSLEPCNHHGRTPPCSEAILKAGIKKVTISCVDPTPKLQGKSIASLREKGIDVRIGLLTKKGETLIQRFKANSIHGLPFIILKWAQSKDGFIGRKGEQVWLSNNTSKLVVHGWRGEVEGIMVGTNTALIDNPSLTNRLSPGNSPHRIILDRHQRLPQTLTLLVDENKTTIFTTESDYPVKNSAKEIIILKDSEWNLTDIMKRIYALGVHSIMVEGGASLLQTLIKDGLWDEARIIHTSVQLHNGIKAPLLHGKLNKSYDINENKIMIINP